MFIEKTDEEPPLSGLLSEIATALEHDRFRGNVVELKQPIYVCSTLFLFYLRAFHSNHRSQSL